TAYDITDWSSDVCSSDLRDALRELLELALRGHHFDAQRRQQIVERRAGLRGRGRDLERTAHLDATGLEGELLLGAIHPHLQAVRSEERRVGKECRWWCLV